MAAPSPKLPSLVDESHAAEAGSRRPSRPVRVGGSNRREIIMIGGAAIALIAAAAIAYSTLGGGNDPGAASRRRTLIDAQTGEVFKDFPIRDGDAYPRPNPKTGTDTLYPAEACYWNRDGTAKLTPTYVFVRAYLGEPGETRCPDCGREVVQHNPLPPDDLMLQAAARAQDSGGN